MEVLRTFVIRIYRQDEEDLAGIIETVDTGECVGFHSVAELCTAVSRRIAPGPTIATIQNHRENDK